MKAHLEAVRQLYQPDIESMRRSLPDLGESLHTAAIELSRDCSVERVDLMITRLKGAESGLVHLRKALAVERGGVRGAGTG
jgi:hypothetical protein